MFGVLETDFSDPGPPPFFEDRPRSAFEDTTSTQRESPWLLRAPRNVVTTLSATGRTPRCCAAQVFLCVEPRPHYIPLLCRAAERSTTIARMRTLVIVVLNNGKQYVDAGLRVKRLKEPSSSAELVLVTFALLELEGG